MARYIDADVLTEIIKYYYEHTGGQTTTAEHYAYGIVLQEIDRMPTADVVEVKHKEFQKILNTEYSERFDKIRKDMMVMSYYKYGPMRDNYGRFKCMNAIGNIEKRLAKYKETGNTEFLADVANFAMIEFMYPSISGARYTPTDSGACDISGFSINEIRDLNKEN